LASGQHVSFVVTAQSTVPAAYTDSAGAYADEQDPNSDDNVATVSQTVVIPSTVTNRFIFYKGSTRFDTTGNGRTPLAFSDDNAIAIDKSAYIPNGTTANFGNYSSYSKGVNGIMVDLLGGGQHTSITLANILNDFQFKVGNNASPGTWVNAPNPI